MPSYTFENKGHRAQAFAVRGGFVTVKPGETKTFESPYDLEGLSPNKPGQSKRKQAAE